MAYALIAHTIAASAGPNPNVTTSAINTTGANLIVATFSGYSINASPLSMTDSKSNTWTLIASYTSTVTRTSMYYCIPTTVGSGHTFTGGVVSGGGAYYPCLAIMAWSGATATPFDKHNGATSTGATSIQTGSVTPSTNNELLLTAVGFAATDTYTVDSSFTIEDQHNYGAGTNFGLAFAYLIQTTAAAVNPKWSCGTSVDCAAEIGTFGAASTAVTKTRTFIMW